MVITMMEVVLVVMMMIMTVVMIMPTTKISTMDTYNQCQRVFRPNETRRTTRTHPKTNTKATLTLGVPKRCLHQITGV